MHDTEYRTGLLTVGNGEGMNVVVEFFGVPRRLAGVAEVTVETGEDTTLRQVLRLVRDRFPALAPSVIGAEHVDLGPAYVINIDGRRVVEDLGYRVGDGEHVLILSSLVGG